MAISEPCLDSVQRADAVSSDELARALSRALNAGEVKPVIQRRVDLSTEAPVGAEVLLRWPGAPEGVGPAEFVAAAERHGLSRDLLAVALAAACKAADAVPGVISVNISGADFSVPGLARQVVSHMEAAGVPVERVEVEITETALRTAREVSAGAELWALRRSGVRVALDDFGTGESILSDLAIWPVDRIKVDRCFVRRVPGCRASEAVIVGLAAMARHLGAGIVAEGVESRAQAEWLRRYGIGEAQGFLFHRPETLPVAG